MRKWLISAIATRMTSGRTLVKEVQRLLRMRFSQLLLD